MSTPIRKGPAQAPKPPQAENGHSLTPHEAREGWISLFDGRTDFGWLDANVENGSLSQGQTNARFGDVDIKGLVDSPGELVMGERRLSLRAGRFEATLRNVRAAPIRLGPGLRLKTLTVRPLGLQSIFNGKDLGGWTVIKHPRLPEERQAAWSVEGGAIRGVGGPGAIESDGRYGNLALQLKVRARKRLANGGVFFRAAPGEFLNGYEAQVFNACYDEAPGQPARYSTGAIDDRQLARRLVSRDGEPFVMIIIAAGPHVATWGNGWQMTDWTDSRQEHANPRQGLRLEAGTIQLQAHDPQTDVEFRSIRIAAID